MNVHCHLVLASLLLGCSNQIHNAATVPTKVTLKGSTGRLVARYIPLKPSLPQTIEIKKNEDEIIIDITVASSGVPIGVKMVLCPEALKQIYEEYALKWRFEPFSESGGSQVGHYILKISIGFRIV